MSTFHGLQHRWSIGSGQRRAFRALVWRLAHLLAVALVLLVLVAVASRPLLEVRVYDGVPVFAVPPRALLGLGVLSFCVLFGEGAVADWSAVYLENVLGSTPAIAATGYAASSLAMAGMRLPGTP